jgi:hypothetical protein
VRDEETASLPEPAGHRGPIRARWRAAAALGGLALGVAAVGAVALPRLRADVPRRPVVRAADVDELVELRRPEGCHSLRRHHGRL